MSEQSDSNRTIQDVNALIRSLIETDKTIGQYFWVGGLITHFYKSHLNHVYFTLDDEGFSIRCMMPNKYLGETDFPLSKGMLVDVYGTIQAYEKRGEVQMVIEKARLVDKREAQFDPNVIKQLEQNGLWPRQRRDLPTPINKIALITSKNSAALEDFRSTYYEQGGKANIEVFDVLIQGEQAPPLIVDAINRVNQKRLADVIVITRGGGRHADLSTFNDYRIAAAICHSVIPVITGIGHQEDDTIADRVADQSTITPTAAAVELARFGKETTGHTEYYPVIQTQQLSGTSDTSKSSTPKSCFEILFGWIL